MLSRFMRVQTVAGMAVALGAIVSAAQPATFTVTIKAKILLADQRRSVTEVATACGFSAPSNFANVFRKITGRTPRGYRRSLN
jgi:YesN/AraC family two-component response regulator